MAILSLSDSAMDIISKMSKGNPGAIGALMSILEEHDEIDPQTLMGGIGAIFGLDTWEIYGTDIYILWNDKCNGDTRKMLMLMRATQLGIFSHVKLKEMAADQARQVNLTDDEWLELDDKVCSELVEFKKPKPLTKH